MALSENIRNPNEKYRHRTNHVNDIFYPEEYKSGSNEISCNPRNNIEFKLVNEIANLVVQALDINWNDREQFKKLLRTTIEGDAKKLVLQFMDYHLQEWVNGFNMEFNINAKVNFDYTPHAKLNDLKKKLHEKILKSSVALDEK